MYIVPNQEQALWTDYRFFSGIFSRITITMSICETQQALNGLQSRYF